MLSPACPIWRYRRTHNVPSQYFWFWGSVEPTNGTLDVAMVTKGGDEFGDESVREFVGAVKEGVRGAEGNTSLMVRNRSEGESSCRGWVRDWRPSSKNIWHELLGAFHVLEESKFHRAGGKKTEDRRFSFGKKIKKVLKT